MLSSSIISRALLIVARRCKGSGLGVVEGIDKGLKQITGVLGCKGIWHVMVSYLWRELDFIDFGIVRYD